MIGSDATFGGRRTYFESHGKTEIFDYTTAVEEGKIPEGYWVWWGYEEQKCYLKIAKEKLSEIGIKDEPFNFTMLTVDTHLKTDMYVSSAKMNLEIIDTQM